MRIIILSQWCSPEPEIKIHTLARDLVARGHEVTTITGYPNYPKGELYQGYKIRWRQWEVRDNVRILRVPLFPDHSRSAIRRIANYLSFALSATVLGPLLSGPADVMWVYHPPLTVGFPALVISRLRNLPFVYEIQDMWPETLAATGLVSSETVLRTMDVLANSIYRRASAITVISPGFKRNLIAKGVPEEKIHVIPNWADEDIYRPTERSALLAAQYGLLDRFNVIYAGNLGSAQALDKVLTAASMLTDLKDFQFVFVGNGVEEEQLRARSSAQGLTNVRFVGRQPVEQMSAIFALAEGLLIHLKNDPLFEITIPSKTISYLACGRPIIAAVAGDAADLIRSAGAGIVCNPEDPEALAQAVRTLYNMPSELRDEIGNAGRSVYLKYFTRSVLVHKYESLFKQLVKG